MTTIILDLHHPADCLPDADTDVLVLADGDTEMQLGAYVGEESDGPVWVDAQGEILPRVVAWAEMPRLPKLAPQSITLRDGSLVDLATAWEMPA